MTSSVFSSCCKGVHSDAPQSFGARVQPLALMDPFAPSEQSRRERRRILCGAVAQAERFPRSLLRAFAPGSYFRRAFAGRVCVCVPTFPCSLVSFRGERSGRAGLCPSNQISSPTALVFTNDTVPRGIPEANSNLSVRLCAVRINEMPEPACGGRHMHAQRRFSLALLVLIYASSSSEADLERSFGPGDAGAESQLAWSRGGPQARATALASVALPGFGEGGLSESAQLTG